MKSPEQTIRELRSELKQKDRTIKQNERTIKQNERTIKQNERTIDSLRGVLEGEDGLWSATTGEYRRGTDPALLHTREVIHSILNDGDKLATMTGYDPYMFEYVYDRFVEEAGRRADAPLFAEDGKPDPGNRCILDRRHVLLLALVRKRSGMTQAALGILFDVDQSTVCRYLRFADSVLAVVLPTADRMTRLVKAAKTREEFEALVPGGTIIMDGTEVPRQRPQDSEKRKRTYSGKKKRFTFNNTVTTNRDGLTLWLGRTFEGGTHDLTMAAEDPVDLGRWSRGMFRGDTPEKDRIRVLADKGYQGLTKHYPGIILEMPEKKPKGRELTARQKRNNKKISSRRITVEHAIGRIKQWGIMKGPYDGTMERFEEEIMVATGLANFRLLWDAKRKRPRLDY